MARVPKPHEIEVVDEAVAAILRTKTPAERIAMVMELNRAARALHFEQVTRQHPDWDAIAQRDEVNRRTWEEGEPLETHFAVPPADGRMPAVIDPLPRLTLESLLRPAVPTAGRTDMGTGRVCREAERSAGRLVPRRNGHGFQPPEGASDGSPG